MHTNHLREENAISGEEKVILSAVRKPTVAAKANANLSNFSKMPVFSWVWLY